MIKYANPGDHVVQKYTTLIPTKGKIKKGDSMNFFAKLSVCLVIISCATLQAQTSFNISNKTTGDTLLTIDDNGRVGIGTTSPVVTIDVKSDVVEHATSLCLGNSDDSHWLQLYSGRGGASPLSPLILWQEGDPIRFASWGATYNEYMRLSAEGNLGIGTTTPSTKLEVADTISSTFGGFMFPDGSVQETAASGGLWNQNGSDIYFNTGNVGIGTTSPAYPLTLFPGTNNRGLNIDHNQTGTGDTYGLYVDMDRTASGDEEAYGIYSATTNDAGAANNYGIYGRADGNATGNKMGVMGMATGAGSSIFGLYGSAYNASGNSAQYGVQGLSYGNSTGMHFGISGIATGTGPQYAVYGNANGSGSSPQYGVFGGAHGSGTGTHYGVYGIATGGGTLWAGYFDGDVYTGGNLGIGTTSPTEMLQVADTIYSSVGGFKFPDGSVQETAAIGGGNTLDQAYDQGGAGAGRSITADNGSVEILGNDGLYVQGGVHTDGGISSSESLILYGSGSEGGQIGLIDGDGSGTWIMDNFGGTDSESFRIFNPDGTTPVFNALVIGDTGNVGIGVGVPDYQLDVDGIIQSRSGGFRFPDGTIQTTAVSDAVSSIDDLIDGKTGGNSVFLGSGTGTNDNGSTNNNTAVGFETLQANTNGEYITAMGFRVLQNSTGSRNSAFGSFTLRNNENGMSNTAIGISALSSNTMGSNNHALGDQVLFSNTTGNTNTGLGGSANYYNQEGSENTIIGFQAGYGSSLHNKSGNVFIGYQAGYNEHGDDKLYIENSNSSTPLIWGDFFYNRLVINGNSTHNANNRSFFCVGQAGGNTAWYNDSDLRLKKNIKTIENPLSKVSNLRGVNFEWKNTENRSEGLQMGFIAQEANEVIPEVVDGNEKNFSMQYAPITALLVEAVKAQQKIIEELKDRIEELEHKN